MCRNHPKSITSVSLCVVHIGFISATKHITPPQVSTFRTHAVLAFCTGFPVLLENNKGNRKRTGSLFLIFSPFLVLRLLTVSVTEFPAEEAKAVNNARVFVLVKGL